VKSNPLMIETLWEPIAASLLPIEPEFEYRQAVCTKTAGKGNKASILLRF